MENASKALIIAGTILLAILLVSLGVMIFNNVGNSAKQLVNMDSKEIANFNAKITPYLGENVSGSQVNALLQYCVTVNLAANKTGEKHKEISVSGLRTLSKGFTTFDRLETRKTILQSKRNTRF